MAGKIIEMGADFQYVLPVLRDNTEGRNGFKWKHHDMQVMNAKAMEKAADAARDIIIRRQCLRMAEAYRELAAIIAQQLPERLITPPGI